MKNKFTSNTNAKVHPNDIVVWYHKSTSYDDKSLKVLGPNTWNHLSYIKVKHPL